MYHTPQKSTKIIIAAACLQNVAQNEGEDLDIDDDEDNRRAPGVPAGHVYVPNVPQPVPNGPDNNPARRAEFVAAHF